MNAVSPATEVAPPSPVVDNSYLPINPSSPGLLPGGGTTGYSPANIPSLATLGVPTIVLEATAKAPTFLGFGAVPASSYTLNQNPNGYIPGYTDNGLGVGIPSILQKNGGYYGGGTLTPTINNVPLMSSGTYSGPKGALPMTNQERFAGYTATGALGSNFSDLEKQGNLPDGTMGKIIGVESTYGTNPKAFNLASGPSGIFQMSEDVGRKYGIVGPGYDLRNDPVAAPQAATSYAADIAKQLSSNLGRPVSAGEVGLGYNQGAAGASALLRNPNASAAEALAPAYNGDIDAAARAIRNNRGDPDAPARQFTDKITQAYQNTPANSPTLVASLQNLATGVGSAVSNLATAAAAAPGNFANTLQSILDGGKTTAPSNLEAGNLADLPTPNAQFASFASEDRGLSPFVIPGENKNTTSEQATEVLGGVPGGNVNAANINPTGEIDWSKGNLPFIDNTKAKEDLYNQPNPNFPGQNIANSVTGDTPETYAQKFTGGDVSQVQSRISYVNGFPQVEFFSKGLDQAAGEMVSGIMSVPATLLNAAGNVFNPTPSDTAKVAQSNPATFADWLSGLLSGEPTSSDNGFRSSQTQPTPIPPIFEKKGNQPSFGGSSPVTVTSLPQQSQTTAADTIPVTQTPVNTTGMDLSRKRYTANPVVATKSIAYPNYQPSGRFA